MSTKEYKERVELLQGTLDLLVLHTLLLGPAHGHAIAKAIEFNSDDVLRVEQGSLVSGAAPADQARMDFRRTGYVREQSPRPFLLADRQRPAAIGRGDWQVGQADRGNRQNSPAGGAGERIMRRRKQMLNDLEQNIQEYIERETEDNIARGMSPEHARSAALRKFGNVAPGEGRDSRGVDGRVAGAALTGCTPWPADLASIAMCCGICSGWPISL